MKIRLIPREKWSSLSSENTLVKLSSLGSKRTSFTGKIEVRKIDEVGEKERSLTFVALGLLGELGHIDMALPHLLRRHGFSTVEEEKKRTGNFEPEKENQRIRRGKREEGEGGEAGIYRCGSSGRRDKRGGEMLRGCGSPVSAETGNGARPPITAYSRHGPLFLSFPLSHVTNTIQ